MSEPLALRPEIYRDQVDSSSFGVVQKPLSSWERIYNQSAGISDFAAAEYAKAEMQYLAKWSGAAPARWIKSLERPRPLKIYAPLEGDIPIDRAGLIGRVVRTTRPALAPGVGRGPGSDGRSRRGPDRQSLTAEVRPECCCRRRQRGSGIRIRCDLRSRAARPRSKARPARCRPRMTASADSPALRI